jgi:predicted dehydrogenase
MVNLAEGLTSHEIVIVGLGDIATAHLEALEQLGQTVVAAVDTDHAKKALFRGRPLPIFRNLKEVAQEYPAPDVIIVSVPTPSHYAVCQEIFASYKGSPLRVLVEKPCANSFENVVDLLDNNLDNIQLDTLLHYAYSPEVLWAFEYLEVWENNHGPIQSFEAVFADPRSTSDQTHRRISLDTSWNDIGINAMSVAHRLINLTDLELHDEGELDYKASVSFESRASKGSGVIATKWSTASSSYDSMFTFEDGAQLKLNHYSVTGSIESVEGAVELSFSNDGTPRRLSHYLNLYKDILGSGSLAISRAESLNLHRLLLDRSQLDSTAQ